MSLSSAASVENLSNIFGPIERESPNLAGTGVTAAELARIKFKLPSRQSFLSTVLVRATFPMELSLSAIELYAFKTLPIAADINSGQQLVGISRWIESEKKDKPSHILFDEGGSTLRERARQLLRRDMYRLVFDRVNDAELAVSGKWRVTLQPDRAADAAARELGEIVGACLGAVHERVLALMEKVVQSVEVEEVLNVIARGAMSPHQRRADREWNSKQRADRAAWVANRALALEAEARGGASDEEEKDRRLAEDIARRHRERLAARGPVGLRSMAPPLNRAGLGVAQPQPQDEAPPAYQDVAGP